MTSGRAQRAGLLLLAGIILLFARPLPARGNPAVDEYSNRFPTASGKDHGNGGTLPTGDPLALPPAVAAQLATDPNGKALAAVATASSLGAPQLQPGDTGSGTSLLHALLDPVVLLLAVAVVAIVLTTQWARRRGVS